MLTKKIRFSPAFTAIELVMVIVVLGIMAVLSMPAVQSFKWTKLQGAKNRIAADIRYTQRLAMSRRDDFRITFTTASESYDVKKNDSGAWNLATDPLTQQSYSVNLADTNSSYKGVDITSTTLSGNYVQFNSLGAPSDSAGAITSQKTISLSYGGKTATVYVLPRTGIVATD